MKYVVTGGLGFIGYNICKKLIEQKNHVVIVDTKRHNDKISKFDDNVELYNVDIRQKKDLEKICENVQGIFHNAALVDVQESITKKDEYYSVNVGGTKNVFEVAKNYDIKVVYSSSASVYGNTKNIPIDEDYNGIPINPYGQTKLDGELLAKEFFQDGLNVTCLRYFNVYGIGQTNTYAGVITQFLRRLADKKPPIIFGDGSHTRDFIHVEDVAEANIVSMQSKSKYENFNVGSGNATSILDLAKLMIKISGYDFESIFKPSLQGDVKHSQASIKKIVSKLKWKPKITLEEGIIDLMKKTKIRN